MSLKIFKHTGSGHYIGSAVIVAASSFSEACDLTRKELDSCGLPGEVLSVEEVDIVATPVIFFCSGDY